MFVCCARARLCLFSPFGSWRGGRLLVRSGLPLPALLPRLLLPAHHSTLGDVMSREKFRRTAPFLDSPPPQPRVSRSSDRGTRKDRRARSRSGSSRDRGRHSRSRSASRSRLSGRERRRRSSSRSLSSRERSRRVRLRSSDRSRSRLVRSHSRGDRSQSSDRYWSR